MSLFTPEKIDIQVTNEELYQAKLIVARNRFWTPELEKLFRRWRRQISKRQQGHLAQEDSYSNYHYLLGIPATVLAAIGGVGALTTFRNCDTTDGCPEDQWIRLAAALLMIVSAVLSALFMFLNFNTTSEQHREASRCYEELLRRIDSTIRLPIGMREDPIACLQDIRNKFDDTAKNSPSIPEIYSASLEYHTIDDDNGRERLKSSAPQAKPPSPDTITDPVIAASPRVAVDTSHLAKLLLDNIEVQKQEEDTARKSVRAAVEQANDYDTDEENKEVTLDFDLEAARPEDIESRKRKGAQVSLAKALQFELGRLYASGTQPAEKVPFIKRPSMSMQDLAGKGKGKAHTIEPSDEKK